MDPMVYTRIVMAGWMFGVAIVLVLAPQWQGNQLWKDVAHFLTHDKMAGLAATAATLLAGLPVVGYLISAVVEFFRNIVPGKWRWFPRNPWRMKEINDAFLDAFRREAPSAAQAVHGGAKGISSASLFVAFLYARAPDPVTQWRRRRLTMFHLGINNAAGLLLGMVVGLMLRRWDSWLVFGRLAWVGIGVGFICFLWNAIAEERRFRGATLAWARVMGPSAIREWLRDSQEKPDPRASTGPGGV